MMRIAVMIVKNVGTDLRRRSKTMVVSIPGLLLVLFVGLKLTGYITWGWIGVFAPLWISAITIISFMIIISNTTNKL